MSALAVLMLLGAADIEPPEFYADNEELGAYLHEAAENHPILEARYEQWRAAMEEIPQVTSLDDPMLSYTQFLQSDQMRFGVMIGQRFPWFGRLAAQGDEAAAEAEAALQRVYVERDALFARVKEAYFEYAYLAQRREVLDKQIELLEIMLESAEPLYAIGRARQDDLFRLEIEITQLMDQYNRIVDMRPAASRRLSEAIGREEREMLPWPEEAEMPPSPPPSSMVAAHIRVANPELTELEHVRESRRHAVEQARLERYPDITFGIGYERMRDPRGPSPIGPTLDALMSVENLARGNAMSPLRPLMDLNTIANYPDRVSDPSMRDNVMVSVEMRIPIQRERIDAGIRQAKARERAARHEERTRQLALDRDGRQALFEVEDAKRRYNLFSDSLIPQAEETFESLERSYISGATDTNLIDVLDTQRMLLDFELEQVGALRDWHVAVAELERLMGGPWASDEQHNAHEVPAPLNAIDIEMEDVPPNEETDDSEAHESNSQAAFDGPVLRPVSEE